jgi:NhaP-type Na+/H+ or K+/H+ antiporter
VADRLACLLAPLVGSLLALLIEIWLQPTVSRPWQRPPAALALALLALTFAYFTIGHLNPVTGFLGAILVGLGLEYGTHLAMRYWEERRTADVLPSLHTTSNTE